jgi:hypothetical protein
MPGSIPPPERDYPALFLALDEVLEALADGRPDEDALKRSFEASADGFGAEKAILLIVEGGEPNQLRAVASRGLSPEEVAACEKGVSVVGVSSSCIRQALEGHVPIMVQDPQRVLGGNVSEVLTLQPCSVLCAPVCHPKTKVAMAVLYVQNEGVRNAFGEIDRAWIEVFARALGRAMSWPRREAP